MNLDDKIARAIAIPSSFRLSLQRSTTFESFRDGKEESVDGVVVGKALYNGAFSFRDTVIMTA